MMTAIATKTVECLRFEPETPRAREALDALSHASKAVGVGLAKTTEYLGLSDWLLLWGPGAPNRFGPMRAQVARGGHVLALDGAYWQRERKFRISIDAAHPQQWVLKKHLPGSRFEADLGVHRAAWNPEGPVLVAGIGEKALVQYGSVVTSWEQQMIAAARASGRRVIYRPKKSGPVPLGVERASAAPIDEALVGMSAVITWHSNVAVDAIRYGIPVVCRDGAAAAVCPSEWSNTLRPLSMEWRQRFLQNLAWFQWAPSEAEQCWAFLLELLA